MGDIVGDGVHSALWYRFIGPHVREMILASEIIRLASLLEDERVSTEIVGTAAKHLELAARSTASDPMPARAAMRQQLL